MTRRSRIVESSVNHPRLVTGVMVALSVVLVAVAGLPTVWPHAFAFLHAARVDTDPENMLPADEPVRVFHDAMKKELGLYDMVVVGVVNDAHPEGVFNPASLGKIHALTEFAKGLQWPDPQTPGKTMGVVSVDIIAPSTVDNIEPGGPGTVRLDWLMPRPPQTQAEALALRERAKRIPFFDGTLVSEDGKAIALYLPLTRKDLSYRVSTALQGRIAELGGPEQFHITGLPVAEDTFGVEMFKQMAISAPLAMLVIFILMFLFFRKVLLIVQPLIVAMVSVIFTMGLLIATGQTIHIMSSMIPIFIMPIAVLDSIHILSEFFDRYQETRDRRRTVLAVMGTLFMPMLYTSLTTAAGFASLALTPIPPVQTFGLFVALGVLAAWVFTVTFIPASIMFIPQRYLENFGLRKGHEEEYSSTPMSRLLRWVGRGTYRWAVPILILAAAALVVAGYGISRIRINDNPTKWFEPEHPIRVADRVLNAHFGGTYMAYLALEAAPQPATPEDLKALADRLRARGTELAAEGYPAAPKAFEVLATKVSEPRPIDGPGDGVRSETHGERLARLAAFAETQLKAAKGDDYDAWDQAALFIGAEQQKDQTFKQPEVLRYVEALQKHLLASGVVGKSNSLADIVKTVYRELREAKPDDLRVPDSPNAVAECLVQYEGGHRPQDLAHFVTRDERMPSVHFRKSALWVQLTSGDNRDMQTVVDSVEAYVAANPPPVPLKHAWFGLTYINLVWQDRMVVGMLESFLGSFLVVLLMMTILYRSALWGLLAMIPLTVTIGGIYGAVGLLGIDYDMPTAVLSALSLGLAVDYAIHFLSRSREIYEARPGPWRDAVPHVFGEPARAITRNVIVIGVGFLPLLFAPLVPYQTVGVFMAAILVLAGVVSLLILPALIRVLERFVFPKTRLCRITCSGITCTVSAAALVGVVALNVQLFFAIGWTEITYVSVPAVLILAAMCGIMSRREKCRADAAKAAQKGELP